MRYQQTIRILILLFTINSYAQTKITKPKNLPKKLPPTATTHKPATVNKTVSPIPAKSPINVKTATPYHPASFVKKDPNQLTFMSYNTRAAWLDKGKGKKDWFKRRDDFLKMILQYKPDILGTQEENNVQREWLEKELKKHGYAAIGKQSAPHITATEALAEIIPVNINPKSKKAGINLVLNYLPKVIIENTQKISQYIKELADYVKKATYGNSLAEYTTIYYKTSRLKLIDSDERIWLTSNKSKPEKHSILNQNLYNWLKSWKENSRIYTRGYFKDKKTGKKFTAINTHLALDVKTHEKQAAKIISDSQKYIQKHPGALFIMGDFNGGDYFVKKIFGKNGFVDTHATAQNKIGPEGTFTNWGKVEELIDFIVAKGPITIHESAIAQVIKDGKEQFPSDHRPKITVISIN